MRNKYRILSVEAAGIYKQEQDNGVAVGYKMPESKSDAYFRLFKVLLADSLDCVELEKEDIKAKYENGVLNVTVPKLEAKKPAQGLIEIE